MAITGQQVRSHDGLGDELWRYGRCFDCLAFAFEAIADRTGVFWVDIVQDLDFRGNGLELIADFVADAGQCRAMGAGRLSDS